MQLEDNDDDDDATGNCESGLNISSDFVRFGSLCVVGFAKGIIDCQQ